MADRGVKEAGRDALDILKRARGVGEVARLLVPSSMRKRKVLNPASGPHAETEAIGTQELVAALRGLRNRLKGEIIDAGVVSYEKLRGSDAFIQMQSTSRLLHQVTPATFGSDAERVAFWVNLYNVLCIHGIIELGIESSVMEIPTFFGTVAYQVGEHVFTPDEIENGVLRRNAKHPATRMRTMKSDDPRLAYSPATVDARIHAALVCAAQSCPPIGLYDPEHLDAQLDLACDGFVQMNTRIELEDEAVWTSVIFRYYADDFGGEDGVRSFMLRHAGDREGELRAAFDAGYGLRYESYDWSLNSAL